MTSLLIDDFVSIYSLPDSDTIHPADAGAQITLGDLHGNAIKLMFMLVRHGVVTNLDAEKYDALVNLYKKDVIDIKAEDLKRFNDILDTLQYNNSALIRLIGDELCDRGSNDYFTLKIIQKLTAHKVPLEIILSNHSIEFIEAYETKLKFFPSMLENHFANSMLNLQALIIKKLVTRDEIRSIFRDCYKSTMKALSYSLNEDNSSIMLYSHAPIDLRAIRAIAKKLKTTFNDSSTLELAKTIDDINIVYQTHVMNNTVHTLYDKQAMEHLYNTTPLPASQYPFEFTMWNRDLRFLNQPATHKGYSLFFAHGHDSQESENKNVFNLDNQLGKTIQSGLGQYTVLYSHEHSLHPTIVEVKSTEMDAGQSPMKLFARTSTSLQRESQTELPRTIITH